MIAYTTKLTQLLSAPQNRNTKTSLNLKNCQRRLPICNESNHD